MIRFLKGNAKQIAFITGTIFGACLVVIAYFALT